MVSDTESGREEQEMKDYIKRLFNIGYRHYKYITTANISTLTEEEMKHFYHVASRSHRILMLAISLERNRKDNIYIVK